MPKRTHDGLKKRCSHKRKTWPDCACPWWFGFHHDGREYRYSLTKLARSRGEKPPKAKDDAIVWRDRLRSEIRGGTFVDPDTIPTPAPAVETRLTFGDVCDKYLTSHVRIPTRRAGALKLMETHIALLRRAEIPSANGSTVRLEQKPIADITKADVEAVRAWRRVELAAGRSRPGVKRGEAGTNRLLCRLRHIFNWSIAEGHLTETPFKRASVTVVKLTPGVEDARTRRLTGRDEQRRILDNADLHLRAVLMAALSTGCRIGELLSLQWAQVRRDDAGEARWLVLPAAKTKTGESRVIPIGADLRAVLSLRRHALDGTEHGPGAFVFGDEAGGQVSRVRVQRQWEDAVLKANGHSVIRTRGQLTPETRAAFQAIDLHVHDLRREFASRLLESSADLHDVQMFLGHAAITTTSRYLRSTPTRLARALDRLEAAGFAHHSHTEESETDATTDGAATTTTPNTLN